jgi:hypothetical protein
MEYHDRLKANADAQHIALVKLQARACLISDEIVALLRSGHPSGAHARWRALHEVAVVSSFLAAGDQELSRRYLLYEQVESLKGSVDYNACADDLGLDPISDLQILEMSEIVDGLCDELGVKFKSKNGWASSSFGFAPTFRDIEEVSGIGHRPYYRMASHPVHAGPKGVAFDLGVGSSGDLMLAGPSNRGLADPGHGMCVSLMQVTTSLVARHPKAGDAANLQVIQEVVDQASHALIRAQRELEADISAEQGSALAAS